MTDSIASAAASQHRLRAALEIELMDPAAVHAVLSSVAAALYNAPQGRPEIRDDLLFRAIGQRLGLHQIDVDEARAILSIAADLRHERVMARWAVWKPGPALSPDTLSTFSSAPLWPSGAVYAEYVATLATTPRLPPPARDAAWLSLACDAVHRRAGEVAQVYARQVRDARMAVGPAIFDGVGRAKALQIARQRAPLILDADLGAIVDEECAAWIRCRHDRELLANAAEAEKWST